MALKVNGRYVEVASAHRWLRKIPCLRPILSHRARKRKAASDTDDEHPADQKIKMQFEAAGLLDMLHPEKPYHAMAKNLYRHHVVVETGDNIPATVLYMSEEWLSQKEFTKDFVSTLLGRAGLNTARLPKRLQKEIRLEVLRIAATDPKLLAPLRAGCFFLLGNRPYRKLREEDGEHVAELRAEAEKTLRAELEKKTLKVIRARAREEGVPNADLEEAMDDDDPESAVIDLICKEPGIFDYDAMGDEYSADQMQCLEQARKELKLEGEVAQLILEASDWPTDSKNGAALKSKLMGMSLKQLQGMARMPENRDKIDQAKLELDAPSDGPNWGEEHHMQLLKRYKMLIRLGFDEKFFLDGKPQEKDQLMIANGQDEATHMFDADFESGVAAMEPRLQRFVHVQAASVGTPELDPFRTTIQNMLVVQEPKTTAEWQSCVSAAHEVDKKVVVLFLGGKKPGYGTDEVEITEEAVSEPKEEEWELEIEGQEEKMKFKTLPGDDDHRSKIPGVPGLEHQFHALASHFKSLVFVLVNVDDEDHAMDWDDRNKQDEELRVAWWDLTTAPGAQLTTTPTLRMFSPGDAADESEDAGGPASTDIAVKSLQNLAVPDSITDLDMASLIPGEHGLVELTKPTQSQLTYLVSRNCQETQVVDDEEADEGEEGDGDNVGGGDLDLYGTYEATSGIGDELRAMVEAMSAGAGVMSALRKLGTMFRISFGHIQIVCWSWSLGWTWPEFVRRLAAWVKSWVFFDIVVIVRPECGIPGLTECGDILGAEADECEDAVEATGTEDTVVEPAGSEPPADQGTGRRLQEPGIIDGFAQTVVRHLNEALSAAPVIGRALQEANATNTTDPNATDTALQEPEPEPEPEANATNTTDPNATDTSIQEPEPEPEPYVFECDPGSGSRVGYLLDGEFWSPTVAGLGSVTCGDEGYNFTATGGIERLREGSLVASVTCEPSCFNDSGFDHAACNALSSDATACAATGCNYTLQSFAFSGCEGVPIYCSTEAGAVLGPIVDGVRVGSDAYGKASAAPIELPSGEEQTVSPTGLFTSPDCTDPWTGLPVPLPGLPPEAGPDPLMAIILAAMTVIFALIFVVLLLRCIQMRRTYVGGTRRFLCCLGLLRRDSITCTYLLASTVQAAGYYLGM
jgi:hypothetical protein